MSVDTNENETKKEAKPKKQATIRVVKLQQNKGQQHQQQNKDQQQQQHQNKEKKAEEKKKHSEEKERIQQRIEHQHDHNLFTSILQVGADAFLGHIQRKFPLPFALATHMWMHGSQPSLEQKLSFYHQPQMTFHMPFVIESKDELEQAIRASEQETIRKKNKQKKPLQVWPLSAVTSKQLNENGGCLICLSDDLVDGQKWVQSQCCGKYLHERCYQSLLKSNYPSCPQHCTHDILNKSIQQQNDKK